MPSLGIVIVSWNSARFIHDCLASIPESYHSQTIVIDNNSSDNTAELVRAGFPSVRLIVNAENVGYAKANNQGLRTIGVGGQGLGVGCWVLGVRESGRPGNGTSAIAPGSSTESPAPNVANPDNLQSSIFNLQSSIHSALPQYVLLLNPDTKLPEQGIERMLAYMDAKPKVGVLAPKLVNPDGSPQPSCRRFPIYRSLFLGLDREYKMADFDFSATQEVEQPMASCLLFRREVFEQIGLFDEQFPMYFNDVDLSRRSCDAGWTTVYFPEVGVWHYRGGSTNQVRPKMILAMHQGLFRYFRKYDKSGWFWLKGFPLAIIIELVALVRIIAWRLRPARN